MTAASNSLTISPRTCIIGVNPIAGRIGLVEQAAERAAERGLAERDPQTMIVVFGGLNMDLVFPVQTLPRPGETVLGTNYQTVAGGKGANQAVAACRAGAATAMAGCVGRDAFGDHVVAELKAVGVDDSAIERVDEPTGCAAIGVDAAAENQIIVASGANLRARADQVPDAFLAPETTVLLQLEVTIEENWRLLARAKSAGARTVLNAAPAQPIPGDVLADLDALIMNEHEAATLATDVGMDTGDYARLACNFAESFDMDCVITLGAAGAILAAPSQLHRVEALAVNAVDTTAAGDAFVGAYAAALDEKRTAVQALHRASIAGALACTRVGAMPSLPSRQTIESRLGALPAPVEITC